MNLGFVTTVFEVWLGVGLVWYFLCGLDFFFFFFFGIGGGGFLFVGFVDDGFGFEKSWVLLNFLVFLGWVCEP